MTKLENSGKVKKILVVRNDRIGDLILSLPAIASLRKGYPDAHIGVLIREYTQEILWNNPDIDEIIIDRNQDVFELARQIAEKRFDLAIVLYPNWRNGWLCWLSGIPWRIGTGYKPVGILFNQKAYIHRTKIVHHEMDYCLKLVEKAGVQSVREKIRLQIKKEDKEYAQSLLEKYQVGNTIPLIGIHPGSGGSALNWPEHLYGRLIDLLSEKYGVKVVLSGSKEEVERILPQTYSQPVNLAGQTTLGQLMAVYSFYHLFIGPSTGPMHIAAGLGKPVIALFPPIRTQSSAKWGPPGEGHTVLMPDEIKCQYKRCRLQKCPFYNCMAQITPERILMAVEKQLS
ncbi:MAG: glycosyltransferase family 9 protein [bacterium]